MKIQTEENTLKRSQAIPCMYIADMQGDSKLRHLCYGSCITGITPSGIPWTCLNSKGSLMDCICIILQYVGEVYKQYKQRGFCNDFYLCCATEVYVQVRLCCEKCRIYWGRRLKHIHMYTCVSLNTSMDLLDFNILFSKGPQFKNLFRRRAYTCRYGFNKRIYGDFPMP